MSDHDGRIVSGLLRAIEQSEFPWALCLSGEDQSYKLATLIDGLRGKPSATGDGKQITSGFAYWGIAPTVAWANACNDPFYPVMQQSIESFALRWRRVRAKLDGTSYHYVSLGVGTGHKDREILQDLLPGNQGLIYVPIDMSLEMIRFGIREVSKGVRLDGRQVLPVQLDISIEENLSELRQLMHSVTGDEPILYSLLGNTMANFDDDVVLLRKLASLLREQDRFLLEVATTGALDDELAREAAEEYQRSRAYQEFVTSALIHHTDLTVNMDSVIFRGSVETDRALRVKVIYQNQTGGDIQVTLPDRTKVLFPDRDTIRLYLSRKYARKELDGLLNAGGVHKVLGTHSGFASNHATERSFGMDLVLFGAGEQDQASPQGRSRADQIWSSFPH